MMNSRTVLFSLSIFLLIDLAYVHGTASNSLSDCQAVASAFHSTINYTAVNITATTGVNVTCSTAGVVCPGRNIGGVCVWQRKLSAVCRNASGNIKIRIQTNGLPPRCAYIGMGIFSELNIDFEVNFNPDVNINSLNINLTTIAALTQTIGTPASSSTVPSASGFVNYGASSLLTITGIAIDGVVIFATDSANNVDPFLPPAGYAAESVDSCLAHCDGLGRYHYHISSGCMVSPPNGSIAPCANTTCISHVANYSLSSFHNYQTMTIIGIAKDGHTIYGPYLSANTRVTAGFDICNGMFYDSIGNYAYFATYTYPYMIGCFGPGNYPSFGPNSTSNGVSSYSMSSYAISFSNGSGNSTTTATSPTLSSSSSSSSTVSSTTMSVSSTGMVSNTNALSQSTSLYIEYVVFLASIITAMFRH